MNSKLLLFSILFIYSSLNAGDLSIGFTSIEFRDGERSGRKIPVEIYYPADTALENAPVSARQPGKFPVVIFTHGYLSKIKSYKNIREMLVPRGYIVIFTLTEGGLFPNHSELARDIVYLAEMFPPLSGDPASLFHKRIDTSICLMGHSMGGGCSFLAAEMTDLADVLVTLAAYNTGPPATDAAKSISIPSLVIGGSKDPVTRPEKHQVPMYDSLASKNKAFINIIGGTHCQMGDHHKSCKLAELLLFSRPGISREGQHKILEVSIVNWLDYFLKEERVAMERFREFVEGSEEIEFRGSWEVGSGQAALPAGRQVGKTET